MTASGVRVTSMSSTAVAASGTANPETTASSSSPKKPVHPAANVVAAHGPLLQQENQATSRPAPTANPQSQPSTRPAPPAHQRSRASNSSPGNAGETVGDYALGETIGKGTFGKVKLGLHLITGEKVAVKILEKKRIVEVADVERVAREIKILKRNRHVNVIQLFEVIDSPERIFLIMEYVDSGEMFEYIVAHHRIREAEAVVLFQQIVDGLDYLHANDVTHRDLKPENLLLQSCPAMPSGLLVKIVDFGLSNTHDNGRLLRTACGSPCYAAPEMIQGKLYKGPMADMWSLGVVLFAMVCGYLPFEDSNTNLLYKKILSADYKLPPFLSHAVQDLIRRILETNPEKRFTAEMIRQHPWFMSARAGIPRAVAMAANCDDVRLRNHILGQLATVGLDPDDVAEALKHKAHNTLTASFYLLYNKLLRLMKDQTLVATGTQCQQPSSRPPPPQPASEKSNGTPRRPEMTADEIRSTGIRTKDPAATKTPPSSSSTATMAVPSSQAVIDPVRRRQSDGPAPVSRPPSSHDSRPSPRAAPISSQSPPVPASHTAAPLSARRPSSVRSGRNLVLLTNGSQTPNATPTAPQRPHIGSTIARPPSQGSNTHGTRVSVSNGMVALSPLAAHHHSQKRPELPMGNGRRQTVIVANTSQPSPSAATISTSSGSQALIRRRVTTVTSVASAVPASIPSGKEDDARMPTTYHDHTRIQTPHRTPQPPSASGQQFSQLM